MLRITLAILVSIAVITVLVLGVRGMESTRPPLVLFEDMADQPKYKAQSPSAFFADNRAQRQPPANTVAWGRDPLRADEALLTTDDAFFDLTQLPVPIDRPLLLRGRQTYNIYCAVCHGATGAGNGITTQYGMINPPSYHSDRLRNMPPGQIFKTITLGKGMMGPYADKVARQDRWPVIAYVRALQRAQHASIEDVPPAARRQLEQSQ